MPTLLLPFNPAEAIDVSEAAARETELRYQEDPHDQTKLAERPQKQAPRHEFDREKRSLGNEPKKRPFCDGGRK